MCRSVRLRPSRIETALYRARAHWWRWRSWSSLHRDAKYLLKNLVGLGFGVNPGAMRAHLCQEVAELS